jgi:hypothetical protein
VLAVENTQRVAGYCALMRCDAGRIADAGEPVVGDDNDGGDLAAWMLDFMEHEALSIGLLGLCSRLAINDTINQRLYERLDYHPTAVLFERPMTGRPSSWAELLYFKYLVPAPRIRINAPDHHRPIIETICRGLGRTIAPGTTSAPLRPGQLDGTYIEDSRQGLIRVREAGYRTANDAAELRDSFRATSEAAIVSLELPLNQALSASVCSELEGRGFAFAGIKPGEGTDLLLMQSLAEAPAIETIQVENKLAMEIFQYAMHEIRRVGQKDKIP